MRSLYSGTALGWTMVGQVTRLPEIRDQENVTEPSPDPKDRSLRDAYQDMIRQGNEVEKTYTVSKVRTEIIVSPRAIYRESLLP
ncbi:MAG TPA: hypothetical protein VJ124_18245 [Pyrinomonadaceae bacterium]|nr:hypothetical protein [Pyrinomonadaceae bacterium]